MPQVTDSVVREREQKYFLPYQMEFIDHPRSLVIVEKSRRIGFTFGLSYKTVRFAIRQGGDDVWFSSADQSSAEEFIRYCERWFRLFDLAARSLGEVVLDSERDVKALVIEASNGKRVNAMTSNPRRFRSKGGFVALDELAFHDDADAMWKAAMPAATWNYPAAVLSTHNGDANRYHHEVEKARRGEGSWALMTVTLERAIADGLVDKVLGRPATDEDKAAFIQQCRDLAGDDEAFQEEYMCIPRSSASAWLPWPLIAAVEHDDAGDPDLYKGGPCFLGRDIARRGDLATIWVGELVGDVLWIRERWAERNVSFEEQDQVVERMHRQYRIVREAWDQTGMGEPIVEWGKRKYGEDRVQGVLFTAATKQAMSVTLKRRFEDKTVRIPPDREIRAAHHAIRRQVTGAGIPVFDAPRSQAIGHADDYWAHALCVAAAEAGPAVGPIDYTPSQARRFSQLKGAW